MKILLILALSLVGCGIRLPQQPKSVVVAMLNTNTGQVVECRAQLVYYSGIPAVGNAPAVLGGSYYSKKSQDDCIRQYEDLGFVRSDTWRWLQKTSNDTGYTMDHVIATHRRIVAKPPNGLTPIIWTVTGLKLEHRFWVFFVFSHCCSKKWLS
jgi:hypothetical protein